MLAEIGSHVKAVVSPALLVYRNCEKKGRKFFLTFKTIFNC